MESNMNSEQKIEFLDPIIVKNEEPLHIETSPKNEKQLTHKKNNKCKKKDPEHKQKMISYYNEYYKREDVIKRTETYRANYYARPDVKARIKAYNARPDVKLKKKEYSRRPDVKKKTKDYLQRQDVKERVSAYNKKYHSRPEYLARLRENYNGNSSKIKSSSINDTKPVLTIKDRILLFEKKFNENLEKEKKDENLEKEKKDENLPKICEKNSPEILEKIENIEKLE